MFYFFVALIDTSRKDRGKSTMRRFSNDFISREKNPHPGESILESLKTGRPGPEFLDQSGLRAERQACNQQKAEWQSRSMFSPTLKIP
jgi:hypothetical protein